MVNKFFSVPDVERHKYPEDIIRDFSSQEVYFCLKFSTTCKPNSKLCNILPSTPWVYNVAVWYTAIVFSFPHFDSQGTAESASLQHHNIPGCTIH